MSQPMPRGRKPATDPLSDYRAKRSLEVTPEPAGVVSAAPGHLFIVHKHAARRLHWDLRLELDGVLMSWAVPKGPSRDPQDKRLAVKVEDHPLEYGDFEGLIPEGNYGAGAVIVWDRGTWVPVEDPAEGLQKGKLLFELKGYKLRGKWTLVKIKRGEKEWLLIKERDEAVSTNGGTFPEGSVLSGLTVEDLKEKRDLAGPLRDELESLGAPERSVPAGGIGLMLAETREWPFSDPKWVFELKLDGYRLLAAREGGNARLVSRNGNDFTPVFPEIARAVAALPFDGLIVDGEVVVLDEEDGRPSFQRLQQRGRLSRPAEIKRVAVEHPATLYLFDLLALEGYDLRALPLVKRKAVLERILPATGPLRYSEHFEERGEDLFDHVERMQLEGIVAKKADSKYRAGRSPSWLKIRSDRTDDFVVVGFTRSRESRTGFGALHLATHISGELRYAGRAGSGFDTRQLSDIAEVLESERRPDPPCTGAVPKGPSHVWVEPRLVCEVRYKEWTSDHFLRHPVFIRFRDDKAPEECIAHSEASTEPAARPGGEGPQPVVAPSAAVQSREVRFTNQDKVFWPKEGYTKGDLIAYYRAVGPWLLEYLRERPLVLTRFPDGIDGKSFFQKDAPGFAPEWVRTERMWSAQSRRELDYFVCDNLESLLYIINLGSIPLHIWASRIATLEYPDWSILDLDPKGAPFTDVVTVAWAIHALCREIELPCHVKTSGSSGLHVMIPLGCQCTYDQSRTLAGLLARVVAAELPEIATMTRAVSRRDGRVYIDHIQNGHGRLLVAPFSARPVPGASVSTPLHWREVTPKLDIHRYTIRNVPTRMRRMKDDPLLPVMDLRPDLAGALERLHDWL